MVGIAVCSCSPDTNHSKSEPEFRLSDLQGYWLQDDDTTEHYVRFTDEQSDETNYLYGYEWNEYHGNEDYAVYESDVLADKYGGGWFKYWLEVTNGGLHEIHLTTNKGVEIPKEYVVTVLTSTKLAYYEKDQKQNKFQFTKVVRSK